MKVIWRDEPIKRTSIRLEIQYDLESAYYDKIGQDAKNPWYSEMVTGPKEFVKLIDPQPNELILDCACGTGSTTIELARTANVHAFDISQKMLDKLKRKLNSESIEIKKASLENIPYDDDTFDKVCCRGTLDIYHPKFHLDLIREMARVLVPGGRLIIDLPWTESDLGKISYDADLCWSIDEIKTNLKTLGLQTEKINDVGMCHQILLKKIHVQS